MDGQRLMGTILALIALLSIPVNCDSTCKVTQDAEYTRYFIWVDTPYAKPYCEIIRENLADSSNFDGYGCAAAEDGNYFLTLHDRPRNGVGINRAMEAAFPSSWNRTNACLGGWEDVPSTCAWEYDPDSSNMFYNLTIHADVHASCTSARTRLQEIGWHFPGPDIISEFVLKGGCYYDDDTKSTFMLALVDNALTLHSEETIIAALTNAWADGADLLGFKVPSCTYQTPQVGNINLEEDNPTHSTENATCYYEEFDRHSMIIAYIPAPYNSGNGCSVVHDSLTGNRDLSVSNYECADPGDGTTLLYFDDRIKNGHHANLALYEAYPDYWGNDTCDSGYEDVPAKCFQFDEPNDHKTYWEMTIDWNLLPYCTTVMGALQDMNLGLETTGKDNRGNPNWQCYNRTGGTTGEQMHLSAVSGLLDRLDSMSAHLKTAWEVAGIFGLDLSGGCSYKSGPCNEDLGCIEQGSNNPILPGANIGLQQSNQKAPAICHTHTTKTGPGGFTKYNIILTSQVYQPDHCSSAYHLITGTGVQLNKWLCQRNPQNSSHTDLNFQIPATANVTALNTALVLAWPNSTFDCPPHDGRLKM